jgi:hypothetical protein
MGPRTPDAKDGCAPLALGSQTRASDVVSVEGMAEGFSHAPWVAEIEGQLWRRNGVRAQDLEPGAFDSIVAELRALPCRNEAARESAREASSAEPDSGKHSITRSSETDDDVRIIEKHAARAVLSDLSNQTERVEDLHQATDFIRAYRTAGVNAWKEATLRIGAWSDRPWRGIRAQEIARDTPTLDWGGPGVGAIDEARVAVISAHREENDVNVDALDTISDDESESIYRVLLPSNDADAHEGMTTTGKFAFAACTEVFRRTGFALDLETVRRAGEAATLDCVAEERTFESQVAAHSRRLETTNRSDVEADIIARDICTRRIIKATPDKLLVLCGYHLMAAMVICTTDWGRLCVDKLNTEHKEAFGTRKPFSSEPPSIVAYTARVVSGVRAVDGVAVKWDRSVAAVAARLELIAKKRKLNRAAIMPKLANLKMTVVSQALLPTEAGARQKDRTSSEEERGKPGGGVPQLVYATSAFGWAPERTHRPSVLLKAPRFATATVERPVATTLSGVRASDAHVVSPPIPRQAARIMENAADIVHVLHVVAPVCTVLMYSDPLPRWAASLLQKDKNLARTVDSVRRDSVHKDRLASPLSEVARGEVDARAAVTEFLRRATEASPGAADLVKALCDRLAPLTLKDVRGQTPHPKGLLSPTTTPPTMSGSTSKHEDRELLWGDDTDEYDMLGDNDANDANADEL